MTKKTDNAKRILYWETMLKNYTIQVENITYKARRFGLCYVDHRIATGEIPEAKWVCPYGCWKESSEWWWPGTSYQIRKAAIRYIIKRLKGEHNRWLAPFSRLYFTILTMEEYELHRL